MANRVTTSSNSTTENLTDSVSSAPILTGEEKLSLDSKAWLEDLQDELAEEEEEEEDAELDAQDDNDDAESPQDDPENADEKKDEEKNKQKKPPPKQTPKKEQKNKKSDFVDDHITKTENPGLYALAMALALVQISGGVAKKGYKAGKMVYKGGKAAVKLAKKVAGANNKSSGGGKQKSTETKSQGNDGPTTDPSIVAKNVRDMTSNDPVPDQGTDFTPDEQQELLEAGKQLHMEKVATENQLSDVNDQLENANDKLGEDYTNYQDNHTDLNADSSDTEVAAFDNSVNDAAAEYGAADTPGGQLDAVRDFTGSDSPSASQMLDAIKLMNSKNDASALAETQTELQDDLNGQNDALDDVTNSLKGTEAGKELDSFMEDSTDSVADSSSELAQSVSEATADLAEGLEEAASTLSM